MKKIKSFEITPITTYLKRRNFIKGSLAALTLVATKSAFAFHNNEMKNSYEKEKLNSFEQITTYNNYYEFGSNKWDPSQNSSFFKPKPWSIIVDGLVNKPGEYSIEDLLKNIKFEDRIYRLRCVEGWSMVIPWYGFSLNKIINKLEPLSSARYVRFETVFRPHEMPGQKRKILPWPYIEGLRMDEAMHPLTILSVGIYGHDLLNQNGAPIRLVVPWKYGFKSIKSIIRISFVEEQPGTTWSIVNPREYGFYSNVNPAVDHPRWSQATERRIGEFMRRPTLMFNGYEEEVSELYKNMDLIKFY